ncbi:MAG: DNA polymerase [Nitrosopumilus sp.]|nr:DNA polymerase [Nitrosopumilus sp.]
MAEPIPSSRFKSIRHLRKIPQYRRKAFSDRRTVYSLDIEATPEGEMLLLANNAGNRLDLEQISLDKALKFLFSRRYENSWCFFWNLHYDARIILRMILLELSPKELSAYYRTGKCTVLGYSIQYIEKKKLSIKKKHHSVNFFDIQQFYFEKSLVDAYQKSIRKLDVKYLEMKDKREKFSKEYYRKNRKQVREYCIKDCILTKELSEHWIDLFYDAFKFYPSHWISSGYLAEKIMINNGINIPLFKDTPEQIQEFAQNTYRGGRIELVEKGYIKDACIVDINSAYPYTLTKVPDLTTGKWKHVKKLQKNAVIGFFKIKANIPQTKHIAPFPFNVRQKIVYPVGEFITFVTLAELQSCEDSSWYEILDSWQYCDDNPTYPYKKIIQKWYDQRQKLKKEKNPMEQPFKIILNSIYGKMAQITENRIGNLFNPVISSSITGIARAMLYDFIIKHGIERDVIMMYTDSITCRGKLRVNSTKLGGFSLDFVGSIYALQNGFYAKDGKWDRSRGIGQIGDDTIEHKETFVDEKGHVCYSFEKIRVGTIKRNLLKGTIDDIGKFSTEVKKLNINGDRGRMWWGRLTDVRKRERNISSPFNLSVFDYKKI